MSYTLYVQTGTVTRAELREALRLAGEAQTAIWVRLYQ